MLKCYFMDISCDCSSEQLQNLYRILPEDRQKKSDGFKNKDVRVKYILSSAFLQYGLNRALEIPVPEISYKYGEYGKPILAAQAAQAAPGIDFNLSHSGKYAVLAVGDGLVGIDVEKRRKDRIALAQRCFCKEEYMDIMAALSQEERDKRFLEYWTMKEAYIKRSGEGLRIPLNSFRIMRQEDNLSFVEDEAIYFATVFDEKEEYCISICSDKEKEMEQIQNECCSFENSMKRVLLEDILH